MWKNIAGTSEEVTIPVQNWVIFTKVLYLKSCEYFILQNLVKKTYSLKRRKTKVQNLYGYKFKWALNKKYSFL